MDTTEITKYLDMAKRRRYWIITPLMVVVLVGLAYALTAKKIYEAQTLILVEPQRVPQNYVRSIITMDINERLRTIKQEVTSRTNLEGIIKEYRLYSGETHQKLILEDKIDLLRRNIKIDVARGSAFAISFTGEDPQVVALVTNALASNFISENLKIRESQALGTSVFLADELSSVEKRLMDKEEELKRYREKYMGGLPEQLDTNLRTIERLQAQLDQQNASLRDAENRKLLLEKDLSDQRKIAGAPLTSSANEPRDIVSLERELDSLRAKYTENHPDVVRLKKMIEKFKTKEQENSQAQDAQKGPVRAIRDPRFERQMIDLEGDMRIFKSEIAKTKAQIKSYQAMVEETPKREQELISLKRDYANLKELYSSLLGRKLEAEIAVSMEKKQKGEQFRVLDPAKTPPKPIKPDIPKILFMALALGLGVGGGLGYGREFLDTSLKTPEDAEKALDMKILVSIPLKYTEQEIRRRRLQAVFKATSLGISFAVSALAIVIVTKGFDKTLSYLKTLIGLT